MRLRLEPFETDADSAITEARENWIRTTKRENA